MSKSMSSPFDAYFYSPKAPKPSPQLLRRLRRNGIVFPLATVRAARVAKVGLPLACALLTVESGGGHNEFGHDEDAHGKCPGYGWGVVTKAKYLAFRVLRDKEGRSNGVGPCQLTSPGLQGAADSAGGCWIPQHNIAVGLHFLHDLIDLHGLHDGCVAYNGSGPAAEAYATRLLTLAEHFKQARCGSHIGILA